MTAAKLVLIKGKALNNLLRHYKVLESLSSTIREVKHRVDEERFDGCTDKLMDEMSMIRSKVADPEYFIIASTILSVFVISMCRLKAYVAFRRKDESTTRDALRCCHYFLTDLSLVLSHYQIDPLLKGLVMREAGLTLGLFIISHNEAILGCDSTLLIEQALHAYNTSIELQRGSSDCSPYALFNTCVNAADARVYFCDRGFEKPTQTLHDAVQLLLEARQINVGEHLAPKANLRHGGVCVHLDPRPKVLALCFFLRKNRAKHRPTLPCELRSRQQKVWALRTPCRRDSTSTRRSFVDWPPEFSPREGFGLQRKAYASLGLPDNFDGTPSSARTFESELITQLAVALVLQNYRWMEKPFRTQCGYRKKEARFH